MRESTGFEVWAVQAGRSTRSHESRIERVPNRHAHMNSKGEPMSDELTSKTIAFLTANEGVEQVELTSPWDAATDAGAQCVLISPKAGDVQGYNHLDKGATFTATLTTTEADPADFDGIVLPGGVANPDQLRMDDAAVRFLRAAFDAGTPVAAICHGPWTLVEADVVRDRTLTSWPSLRTDIGNAGGTWVDQEVAVCTDGPNVLVSSRKPDDLDAFNREMIAAFAG
jgi:protease I